MTMTIRSVRVDWNLSQGESQSKTDPPQRSVEFLSDVQHASEWTESRNQLGDYPLAPQHPVSLPLSADQFPI